MTEAAEEPGTGEQVGPYRITALLGKGGMGTVYLAEDVSLDRRVALKMLPAHLSQDAEIVARFQREARSLAKLRHPNLMHIYQVGEHKGRPYFAMEYIKGSTLSSIIGKAGRFPPPQAVHVIAEVLAALDKVHRAGIIHRDVKPGNIIIDEDGHAILMDFGLARQESDAALTADHTVLGTPNYMSPEQARGERLDPRTDIYSVGIVLYEMLTGAPPFKGKTSFEILRQHIETAVPAPSGVQPDVPGALDPVVARALAKSPAGRFQTVRELAGALAAVLPNSTLLELMDGLEPGATARTVRMTAHHAPTVRVGPGGGPGAEPRSFWSRPAVVAGLAVAAGLLLVVLVVVGLRVLGRMTRARRERVPPPVAGQLVEVRRAGQKPIRGRLAEIEILDDGTTIVKITADGADRPQSVSIREGDELQVVRDH